MRVVASVTTLPSRMPDLPRLLESIRHQTFPLDAIYLNIPAFSIRERCAYDLSLLAPEALLGVTVLSNQPDDGPITKLLPTLDAEPRSEDTFIVLVDDDISYHPRCVENMMKYATRYPAIGATGRTAFKVSKRRSKISHLPCHIAVGRPMPVLFLETWSMVIYRRDLFPESATEMRQWMQTLPPDAFFVDDIVISAWIDRFTPHRRWLVPVKWLPGARRRLQLRTLPNPLRESNTHSSGRNLDVLNQLAQEYGYFQDSVRYLSSDLGTVMLAILLILGLILLVSGPLVKFKK